MFVKIEHVVGSTCDDSLFQGMWVSQEARTEQLFGPLSFPLSLSDHLFSIERHGNMSVLQRLVSVV